MNKEGEAVDKLGAILTLLRLMSISLQLISIVRQVIAGSLAVLLVFIRLLSIAVTLVHKALCKVLRLASRWKGFCR